MFPDLSSAVTGPFPQYTLTPINTLREMGKQVVKEDLSKKMKMIKRNGVENTYSGVLTEQKRKRFIDKT